MVYFGKLTRFEFTFFFYRRYSHQSSPKGTGSQRVHGVDYKTRNYWQTQINKGANVMYISAPIRRNPRKSGINLRSTRTTGV